MYDEKAETHDCRGINALQLVASSLLVTPRRRHPLLYFLLKAEAIASCQRFGIDLPTVVSGSFARVPFQKDLECVGCTKAFVVSLLRYIPID